MAHSFLKLIGYALPCVVEEHDTQRIMALLIENDVGLLYFTHSQGNRSDMESLTTIGQDLPVSCFLIEFRKRHAIRGRNIMGRYGVFQVTSGVVEPVHNQTETTMVVWHPALAPTLRSSQLRSPLV